MTSKDEFKSILVPKDMPQHVLTPFPLLLQESAEWPAQIVIVRQQWLTWILMGMEYVYWW